jgi:hypothetical protein
MAQRHIAEIQERARANLVESGERFGKGSQNSDEPIERIRTDETLADMANVGRTTLREGGLFVLWRYRS